MNEYAGKYVRVVLEGYASDSVPGIVGFWVSSDDKSYESYIDPHLEYVKSIEVIDEPLAPPKVGDVVSYKEGWVSNAMTAVKTANGWWFTDTGEVDTNYSDALITKDVTTGYANAVIWGGEVVAVQ